MSVRRIRRDTVCRLKERQDLEEGSTVTWSIKDGGAGSQKGKIWIGLVLKRWRVSD